MVWHTISKLVSYNSYYSTLAFTHFNLTPVTTFGLALFFHSIRSTYQIASLTHTTILSYLSVIYYLPPYYLPHSVILSHNKYISHFFIYALCLIHNTITWTEAYTADPETTLLLKYLLYYQLFEGK